MASYLELPRNGASGVLKFRNFLDKCQVIFNLFGQSGKLIGLTISVKFTMQYYYNTPRSQAHLCPSARREKQYSGDPSTKLGCDTDLSQAGASPATQSKTRKLEVVVTRHCLPSGV